MTDRKPGRPSDPSPSTVSMTTREWIDAYEGKPGAEKPPLDPAIIPNYMGINLSSVQCVTWSRQADGQLTSMTISFNPDKKRGK
jgi:hypothetical protein